MIKYILAFLLMTGVAWGATGDPVLEGKVAQIIKTAKQIYTTGSDQSITGAGDTITPTGSYFRITSDADYVMTSTPTIAAGTDGEMLIIHNKGSFNVTLQDESSLGSSNILLGRAEGLIAPSSVMMLIYDAESTAWEVTSNPNSAVFGTGSNADTLNVRNTSGGVINAGRAVYITGFHAQDRVTIAEADADDSGKVPAIGFTTTSLNNNTNGIVVTFGDLIGLINTVGESVGGGVWLSTTAGAVVFSRPATDDVQRLGTITRVNASGNILVTGAGRINDAPNDLLTATTIGSAYIYRVGGTDVAIADGGTGTGTATAGFDALSPMTAIGDIIYGGASGTGTRLAAGTANYLLQTNGAAAPTWVTNLVVTDVTTTPIEDPVAFYDALDPDDTDWYGGTNADGGTTSNDCFEYRTSSTPGSEVVFKMCPDGTISFLGPRDDRLYTWKEEFDEEAAGVTLEAGLRGDEWTGGGTNGADANKTYQTGVGGTLELVTNGTGDNDSEFAVHLANIRVDSNPIVETRFKVDDITSIFACIGLVEGTFVTNATPDDDIALVCIDTDQAAANLYLLTTDNGAAGDYDDTGTDLVNDTYVKVKFDLTDTEQPKVWVNDVEVSAGSISGTVQAGTTVSVYAMVQVLVAGPVTRKLTIDYINLWQDRG